MLSSVVLRTPVRALGALWSTRTLTPVLCSLRTIPYPCMRRFFGDGGDETPPPNTEEGLTTDDAPSDNLKTLALLKRQRRLEMLAVDQAVQRYRKTKKQVTTYGKAAEMNPSRILMLGWFKAMVNLVEKEQQAIRDGIGGPDRRVYGPYLMALPPEKLAVITIHELLSTVLVDSARGAKYARVAHLIGKAVQAEVNLVRLRSKPKAVPRLTPADMRVDVVNRRAQEAFGSTEWGVSVQTKVGGSLIGLLLKAALVDNPEAGLTPDAPPKVPAFNHRLYKSRERDKIKYIGYVSCHEHVFKTIENGHLFRESLHPRHQPMLVPPRPWTAFDEGGFLTLRSLAMRTKNNSRMQIEVLKVADLHKVFDALNALGSTPWIINAKVHDVMEQVWKEGGGLAALPPRQDYPIPPPPGDGASPEETKKWLRAQHKIKHLNRDLHSLRCDMLYKLEVARKFRNSVFYFPYNLDFRGRAYPIPPHLNHLGADCCRGLLKFAEGKSLGARGLWWVKVHLANLMGRDKLRLEDREAFVNDNLSNVFDSADNPLGGNRWWLEGEDPWQALATCFELTAALRSPNPEAFVSNLPVHQDGSCNGLQHYAALGRDVQGAEQVNLLPNDTPQDVYSGVCALVNERIAADAASGVPIACFLMGKVDRKVVKQTVMTSVYGVTFVGARQQIQNRLKERTDVPEDQLFSASSYIAQLTLNSLGRIFSAATNIMEWLAQCARIVAKNGQPVCWVTPLGLPVVQPYRRFGQMQVKTIIQNVVIADFTEQLPVSPAQQRSAFPPNYVHSLDSSHMMLTASECKKQDIAFAAVHDSYWTHAGTVERMNHILRKEFISLHSEPLLENLLCSLEELLPLVEFPPVPPRGDLDLQGVLRSSYFFD